MGYSFSDPGLIDQALSHRSWCAEQGGLPSNERLEFLGDAVLGLVVADHTYRNHPELAEGVHSKTRAAVVNARVLADVGRELKVGPYLRLGRGEDQSGGREKDSILSDAVEAIFGAVYLDGGFEEAQRVILGLLSDRIEVAIADPGEADHKSRLQEMTVSLGRGIPRYEVAGQGPDHDRRYHATVYVADQPLGTGEGRSKKDAEQEAARVACGVLGDEREGKDA
ncbi:MAG TPA: ribonuclease III [Acidimicrobiales bacterium]|nr:ribonuclease III [Acidimicrobiales bacterium]